MRLQKFLSHAGVCSRRHGESLIAEGRVGVNGRIVTVPGVKVDLETDRVTVDGEPVTSADRYLYIALNKPAGFVTSCSQPGDRVVLELIDLPDRLYPIGRLDKDSTGLLLLTNDGRLHHRLLHPSFDHEKEYEVTLARPVPDGALRRMAQGMPILGKTTRPADIRRISGRRFRIVLREGRNRQIRRMVRKIGGHVVSLERVRVAGIRLGRLPQGKWRHLTASEVSGLLATGRE